MQVLLDFKNPRGWDENDAIATSARLYLHVVAIASFLCPSTWVSNIS